MAVNSNIAPPDRFYAWKFSQQSNDQSARRLFFAALMYLPALFVLLMLHKRGRDEDEDEDEDGEELIGAGEHHPGATPATATSVSAAA